MKITTIQAALGSALLLWNAQPCAATAQHRHHHLHLEKKHAHSHVHSQIQDSYNPNYMARNTSALVSRDGKKKCAFPLDKGLQAVTPTGMNGGWAMAPDQECVSGTWCPIACPSGKVSTQWKPDTHYRFPESTYGGVYCNDNGEIDVPFKNKPWCVDGTGSVKAVNKAGNIVSFCQTCLPGYEDMIIPTDVIDSVTLAVPDTSYWDSTAAHYYINAPGVNGDRGCHWGNENEPIGNWSPYVAGANTDAEGRTFVKLGLNPVWQSSPLFNNKPSFGLRIECPGGDCQGIPCKMDGNGVTSNTKANGAGGSDFCVVTVPKGSKANIVVEAVGGPVGGVPAGAPGYSRSEPEPTSSAEASPTPDATTTSSAPSSTSTSSSVVSTSTSASASSISSTSSEESTTSSSTSSTAATSNSPSSSSSQGLVVSLGGIFQENVTSSTSFSQGGPSATPGSVSVSNTGAESGAESASSDTAANEGAAQPQGGAAIAGLIVAFVAAGYLL